MPSFRGAGGAMQALFPSICMSILLLAASGATGIAREDAWLSRDTSASNEIDGGQYLTAEKHLLQALKEAEKEAGSKKIARQAATLRNLHRLYVLHQQILAQEEKLLSASDGSSSTATSTPRASGAVAAAMDDVAELLLLCGKKDEAATMHERSQAIKAELPGALPVVTSKTASSTKTVNDRPIKKKWALVIGISNFKDPSLNLRYATKDARDFANYLAEAANFPRQQIKLLIDEDATRQNIVSSLGEDFLAGVGKDDLVIVYISSHGGQPVENVPNPQTIRLKIYEQRRLCVNETVMQGLPSASSRECS